MALWKVRTLWTGGPGGGLITTHYFDQAGGSAVAANAAVGAFWTAVKPFITSGLSYATEAQVYAVSSVTGEITGLTPVGVISGAGTNATEALPFATQALVQWRTGVFTSGREIRGRTFIPGMVETSNVAGVPGGTLPATFNTAATALISDPTSQLVIWSQTHLTAATVVTGTTWGQWAVLRSRRL